MFSDLLQRVVKPRSRATKGRQRRRGLRLEPLESRCVLSTAYLAVDLVADQPGIAPITDSQLVNGWGVAISPTSGIWVSSNGEALSTSYTVDIYGDLQKSSKVSIPYGAPTGQVFNSTSDFVITSDGLSKPATFIFASDSGVVTGWNSQAGFASFRPTEDAVYTGIALAKNGTDNLLYLADFHNKKIDVLNSSFQLTPLAGDFTDPRLPRNYAPFNVAAIGGKIYVAYAKQDTRGNLDTGSGKGYVDVFNPDGTFVTQLAKLGRLNAPWAIVQAPANFGDYSDALLVGNFGDGRINAYDTNGSFEGALRSSRGNLEIDGLRGLAFGNGGASGAATTLYYAAGPDEGTHGLLGKITANAAGTSAVTASLAGDTLTITGSRDRDNVRVTREGARQQIVVRADGKQIGMFDPAQVGSIHFHGWAGDDLIVISPSVKATAILDGGAGNDRLISGGGNSILLGGLGNDFLHTTFGRNVLIGGEGRDNFQGGIHDDLLIAGTTAHDADTAALLQILAEWTSADSYNTRVSKLRNGTDGLPQLDATTVFDNDARDFLLGKGGLDWFFASTDDKLAGRRSNEQRQ